MKKKLLKQWSKKMADRIEAHQIAIANGVADKQSMDIVDMMRKPRMDDIRQRAMQRRLEE